MKEKLEDIKQAGGPVRGLLTVLLSAAGFLVFLVAITWIIQLIMR